LCKPHDLTDIRFGRLTAKCLVGRTPQGQCTWLCQCDCGNLCVVAASDLKKPKERATKSCGCLRREHCRELGRRGGTVIHGQSFGSGTLVYRMWLHARKRAKKFDVPFSLSLEDIVIPDVCPVFGIPLVSHHGGISQRGDDSPTLDRVIPKLGYTPSNVWVISHRANRLKSDATLDELRSIANTMQRGVHYGQA
jgi:hypothetical protein